MFELFLLGRGWITLSAKYVGAHIYEDSMFFFLLCDSVVCVSHGDVDRMDAFSCIHFDCSISFKSTFIHSMHLSTSLDSHH